MGWSSTSRSQCKDSYYFCYLQKSSSQKTLSGFRSKSNMGRVGGWFSPVWTLGAKHKVDGSQLSFPEWKKKIQCSASHLIFIKWKKFIFQIFSTHLRSFSANSNETVAWYYTPSLPTSPPPTSEIPTTQLLCCSSNQLLAIFTSSWTSEAAHWQYTHRDKTLICILPKEIVMGLDSYRITLHIFVCAISHLS